MPQTKPRPSRCDICLRSNTLADDHDIKQYGDIAACVSCVIKAVQFAYTAACTFFEGGARAARMQRDELQAAIMRLPAPPAEVGDGPTERVGDVLRTLSLVKELIDHIRMNSDRVVVESLAQTLSKRGC